ncbi:epoxyqueuosine reductase [Anaerocolumna sedimenticola]|uniref:Epoxyqueuosine reductase n=1 Tax=Anaerocolumna sedimenticola TaxID=2696063 RepID=A0A6P1TNV7_9FIRM|nr:4Fe-4S dicluster domain-containing protein [Anaerocolumna sedimenticola]QHQ62940.1 epoxyqueuosine reductase [Anaerocolumna sedimenticola]
MISEIKAELKNRGADFIKVVDITKLQDRENRGYHSAILIGITLSPDYIYRQIKENTVDHSEFGEKEHRADELADWLTDFIISKGYDAFSQSERNLIHGFFNESTKTTPLPHKKIAMLTGIGWIGKSNLLVTKEYGSAVCMCTVLTNAPLLSENRPFIDSQCKGCTKCIDICPANAIHGSAWEPGMNRDCIVDVYKCEGCLKCLISCPWTIKYMEKYRINICKNNFNL